MSKDPIAQLRTWRVRRQEAAAARERENLELKLAPSERGRIPDPTTGVSNRLHRVSDIKRWSMDALRKRHRGQLVLIDICGFEQINQNFGFEKADKLLGFVAQEIFGSTPRPEDVRNARPRTDSSAYQVDSSVNRNYARSDEFLFIVRADLVGALDFIDRLRQRFQLLSKEAAPILGEQVELAFHCGVARMFSPSEGNVDALAKFALDTVSECRTKASKAAIPARKFSICWDKNAEDKVADWPAFCRSELCERIQAHFSIAGWPAPQAPAADSA